jgi:hypothetical protein
MRLSIRPALLGWGGLLVALLVGIRSPAWGFRLLVVLACVALILRFVGRSR